MYISNSKLISLNKFTSIFVFLVCFFAFSQQKSACETWRNDEEKIVDFNKKIAFCHKIVPKVDLKCKIEIYLSIANSFSSNFKIDSTTYYFDKAINLSIKYKLDELLAESYSEKAYFLANTSKVDEAEVVLKKAQLLFLKFPKSKKKISYYTAKYSVAAEKSEYENAIKYNDSNVVLSKLYKFDDVLADSYHNIGFYYYELSNYDKSAKNLLLALKIKERIKQSDIGNTYYMLGTCYEDWQQFETAIKYLKKAIVSSNNQKNFNVSARTYVRISKTYRNLKQFDNAKKAIDSALFFSKKIDIKDQYAEAVTEKGWLYLQNYKDTLAAENYFLEGHKVALASKNQGTIFFNLQSVLLLYFAKKQFQKATPFMPLFEKAADDCNTKLHTREKHNFLSKYYEGIGQYKLALINMRASVKIKDSIGNATILTQVADLEKKYDTKNKELKIVSLSKEKDAQKQLTEKARFKQYLFLFFAVLLATILGFGFVIFKKIKAQKNELTLIQEKLENNNKKLTELDSVKNRLFSIIAHDLRSMLIPFQRSGKLLNYFIKNNEEENVLKTAFELEKNSDNLSSMLDNLLNWSLDQMNGYTYNPVVISVKTELQEILNGYKQQAEFKNTKLELNYLEEKLVKFDKGAFHVIFRNIIGNSLKYTENGIIKIEVLKDFNSLKFNVIDTGIGMTKEQLDTVFKLEENKTTIGTQGEKGTGIGLNLVTKFVEMHNGKINVSSEKRIGTKFELLFPITNFVDLKQNDTLDSQSA